MTTLATPCIAASGHRILHGANRPHCWICGLILPDPPSKRPPGPSGRDMPRIRAALARRDGAVCFYCGHQLIIAFQPGFDRGEWIATLDHRTPRCQGGTNRLDNLVLACKQCNQAKGDLTVEQWAALGFPRRRESKRGTFIPVEGIERA